MSTVACTVVRYRVCVAGTVQGVGFRPFVYRQAAQLGLAGSVHNDSAGVIIDVEGPPDAVDELCRRLRANAPPLARVASVSRAALPARGSRGFRIVDSSACGPASAPVAVDAATCDDCLNELFDRQDRRFGYPFINCTNCGPRYTIVRGVPYDRATTTMDDFVMCARCRAEYDDPASRRFHAEPNACPDCGPTLTFWGQTGTAALTSAIAALTDGAILAIKGLGGYHLAVDATDEGAVAELRRRKQRDDKPFAVMVPTLSTAHALCELSPAAEDALRSPRRPIVLAPRAAAGTARGLATGVAPDLPDLGVMLPYSPLHHLLAAGVGRPVVLTSGNVSDAPIAHDDRDAAARLGPLVDGIVTHDRAIHIPCDDSVVRATHGRVATFRRSRGYAPEPIALPVPSAAHVLAVGGELKNTVSVAKDGFVVASHHIGNLEHPATHRSFLQAVEHLCELYAVEPALVAHDLHPEYLSTKFATDLDLPLVAVQHHHAHVASCLCEHGRTAPVVALAFDGLGMGADGTLWGGEVLVADLCAAERTGHLWPVVMPGGAAAVREPWRMAASWAFAADRAEAALRLDERAASVAAIVDRGAGPLTTSAGRLFDAVSALLGLRRRVTYEGQAAVALEALARQVQLRGAPSYPVEVTAGIVDPRPLVAAVIDDAARGRVAAEVAAGFHAAFGRAAAAAAGAVARSRGLTTVVLTGGVFQNALLSEIVESSLEEAGLEVLTHAAVPANDGGLSIGQAAIAAARAGPSYPPRTRTDGMEVR